MEVQGIITKIMEVEEGTSKAGKEWKKQVFVIDTGAEYNPEIAFQLFGDTKIENFAKFNKLEDEVVVSFNLSSREYNGKYFHNVDAWMIKNVQSEEQPAEEEEAGDTLPF